MQLGEDNTVKQEESFEDGTKVNEVPEQSLKRLHKCSENGSNNGSGSNPVKKLKLDSDSASHQSQGNDVGKQPLSPASLDGRGSPIGLLASDSMLLEMQRSYKGIELSIPDVGLAASLTTEAEVTPLRFTNDPDIDDEGNIYFIDSSVKYQKR